MIFDVNSINMEHNIYNDRLLKKSFYIIKKNIDNNDIKTEVFSLNISTEDDINPTYRKVLLKRNKYNDTLSLIMDYYIDNEWYEDCANIKQYKEKLKQLQNNNNSYEQSPRVKSEPIKA